MTEKKRLVPPKYLTEEMAKQAMQAALMIAFNENSPLRSLFKRPHLHAVVLVPAVDADYMATGPWPSVPAYPYVLYQYSHGCTRDWEHEYAEIAASKAVQVWNDRSDGNNVIPHLLYLTDTHYWGGVKREQIVVVCSGEDPWSDRLFAGIVADSLIALARDAFEKDEGRKGRDFLR